MADHCFISYSTADALDFARILADELEGGRDEFVDVWFDKDDIDPARDWDDQIVEGIRSCKCMAFVMTKDSISPGSMCKNEWTWALKYKKVIIPIRLDKDVEQPFGLGIRQWIDFTGEFDHGLAKLRKFLREMDTPKGTLQALQDRLADAEHALRRSKGDEENRIRAEIDELKAQIKQQEQIVQNPKAAERQTQNNINAGLERERQPQKPLAGSSFTKFINPPPGVAPNYFQDRLMETEQVILFLKNDAQRLMTIIGRGGVGKTAMICRLLKYLENGVLPDELEKKHGKLPMDGIVYLSDTGTHKVNFANLFADLCLLLPDEVSVNLSAIYKDPQTTTEFKTLQLLEACQSLKQTIVLLDNFENKVNSEGQLITDLELFEALKTVLHSPHHPLKFIITTRITAQKLNLYEPARHRLLSFDTGLASEYAKEALILMDENNLVGIKNAGDELLNLAVTRTLGLPRALEALYAALRYDRYTTLQELLKLPVLPENVVEAYVGEAFNRLDTNAQKVMQALAVYNRPVTPAAVDYLLAPHLPVMNSTPILQRLANMHFARKDSGRFYLHPVDQEFAYNLIPEGHPDDKLRAEDGLNLYGYLLDLNDKYPGMLENQEAFDQATRAENSDLVIDIVTAFQNFDTSLIEKMQDEKSVEDEAFLLTIDQSLQVPKVWNRYCLSNYAASYFAKAGKPIEEWRNLSDLTAQLSEFELRCDAENYDLAGNVLLYISKHLQQWGHYHLIIDLHLRLKNRLSDKILCTASLNELGNALWRIGKTHESITIFEEGLTFSQENQFRSQEGDFLGNLGNAYHDLGEKFKAIEFYEQALVIARENEDITGEGIWLGNLGIEYAELGDVKIALEYHRSALKISVETEENESESYWLGNIGHDLRDMNEFEQAIESYQKAMHIGDEHSYSIIQNYERWGLAQVHLFQNELVSAHNTIEAALQYDAPQNNHNVAALDGIIYLRQADEVAARQAFARAIAQADEILVKTPEYYSALDAKGLALCGLAVIEGDSHLKDDCHLKAIETFRAARKIAPHAGIVNRNLRLFDDLAKCDTKGILKDVRQAVEGKGPPSQPSP